MSRVFISYRRIGSAGFAHLLRFRLQMPPLALWEDDVFLDDTSIEYGEEFPERIRKAISVAKVFLLLVEAQWLDATYEDGQRKIDREIDFCRQELIQAPGRLQAGEEFAVIPIVCGESEFPSAEKLPGCLRSITNLNRAQLEGKHLNVHLSVNRSGLCQALPEEYKEISKGCQVSRRTGSYREFWLNQAFMRV